MSELPPHRRLSHLQTSSRRPGPQPDVMAEDNSKVNSLAASPLSGGYLLVVLAEPNGEQHKQALLQRLAKGKSTVF